MNVSLWKSREQLFRSCIECISGTFIMGEMKIQIQMGMVLPLLVVLIWKRWEKLGGKRLVDA